MQGASIWATSERGRIARQGAALFLAALFLLTPAVAALAEPIQAEISAAPGSGRLSAEERDRLWREASRIERETVISSAGEVENAVERYEHVGDLFGALAGRRGRDPQAGWRSGRAYWLAGEALPVDLRERRLAYYERAKAMTSRALEADPRCAECMLWKFISLGRIRTAGGDSSTADLREMARLLDEGIALRPTYSDDANNSTLGNLHYSSAIFYRVFPDWFFIGWLLGVKGDKPRAYRHAEAALALHPDRFDYQVELGTQLLCLGTDKDRPAKVEAGLAWMRGLLDHEPAGEYERRALIAVEVMIEAPEKACGYSGDTWLEIDEREAMRDLKGDG